ncbi:MAG: DUF5996 family protein, partial [Planctomycetota bacterium]
MSSRDHAWPELAYADWKDTQATLHMWTQIIGKVRLAQTPWRNHAWHVTLYPTARGLTTSPVPHGDKLFTIDFDFMDHVLKIRVSDGGARDLRLEPKTVADFHAEVMTALEGLGVPVRIHPAPNEVDPAIPFAEDTEHASYDAAAANRFWRVLIQTDRVFKHFQTGFLGKVSPSHFFWGSFDHAVTRFSGRTAPLHPGGLPNLPLIVAQEAYTHEVSSAGFWPGGEAKPEPIYYSYAYPSPGGFAEAPVQPADARFDETLGEFVLPYEAVRTADDPDAALLAFLQSTYDAAADLGKWDRAALDCVLGQAGVCRT